MAYKMSETSENWSNLQMPFEIGTTYTNELLSVIRRIQIPARLLLGSPLCYLKCFNLAKIAAFELSFWYLMLIESRKQVGCTLYHYVSKVRGKKWF